MARGVPCCPPHTRPVPPGLVAKPAPGGPTPAAAATAAVAQRAGRQQRPGEQAARRQAVLATLVAWGMLAQRGASAALEELNLLPETQRGAPLPKGYQAFAGKLVAALQATLRAELEGADEREVRKKAEPAKNLVREWVADWRDDRRVRGDLSHAQITETIQELGRFYGKQGQRARLPRALAESLLAKLDTAERLLA